MLSERGGKQQQQQLSQKASARQTVTVGDKGALREQRISGVAGLFSSSKSLTLAFMMCSDQMRCYLSTAANSNSSSSARKRQPDRPSQRTRSKPVQSTTQRRPKAAPNGTNHQPSATSSLPAAPSMHVAALRRTRRRRRTTQTATWPQQAPPPPQGSAGGRPRSRCSDSCRAPSKLALYPLPALAPHCTHHERPCKQASGGLPSPLPPPRRGAAASSPPPSPVISPMPTATRSHFSLAASISTEISTGYRNYGKGPYRPKSGVNRRRSATLAWFD